jgi:signal transduction histidine kinase
MHRFLAKWFLTSLVVLIICWFRWSEQPAYAQIESVTTVPFQRIQLNGYDVMPQPGQPLLIQQPQNKLVFWIGNPFPNQPTHFSYQIESKTGWVPVDSAAAVVLNKLPFHSLIVRIKAQTRNKTAINHLILTPLPFWQNWWFWPLISGLVLLIASAAIWLLFQYKYRQFLRLQQTRDRIARDLHDDMGSYLSSISILSRSAALNTTRDPDRAQKAIERIGQTARQVMGAMSDIVWSINPDHDSLEKVVARMRDVANELFADTGTTISLEADPAVLTLSLPLEKRHDFFLIFKEALTNTARYAEATQVRVRLQREGVALLLTIQDNGRGFDVAQPRASSGGGNGLKNMHKRAENMGSSLEINSIPGQGTTVTLVVKE